MIEDNNFAVIIEQFMEKNEVDVCGPDMVTLKGNHQNPLQLKPYTTSLLDDYFDEHSVLTLINDT